MSFFNNIGYVPLALLTQTIHGNSLSVQNAVCATAIIFIRKTIWQSTTFDGFRKCTRRCSCRWRKYESGICADQTIVFVSTICAQHVDQGFFPHYCGTAEVCAPV